MRSLSGRALVASALLAFGGASVASGGTIATPPIPIDVPVAGVQTMYCDLVNLDVSARDVTIEIMDLNGAVVDGPFTQTLAPSEGTAYQNSTGTGAWCRFTVDGSAKKYRGLAAYDDGTTYTVSIPAL